MPPSNQFAKSFQDNITGIGPHSFKVLSILTGAEKVTDSELADATFLKELGTAILNWIELSDAEKEKLVSGMLKLSIAKDTKLLSFDPIKIRRIIEKTCIILIRLVQSINMDFTQKPDDEMLTTTLTELYSHFPGIALSYEELANYFPGLAEEETL